MKLAASVDEFAYIANPGALDFMVGPDGRYFVWYGGSIVGIPRDGFPVLRKLLVWSPWDYEDLGWSQRLGVHLFRRGSDKLLRHPMIQALVQSP